MWRSRAERVGNSVTTDGAGGMISSVGGRDREEYGGVRGGVRGAGGHWRWEVWMGERDDPFLDDEMTASFCWSSEVSTESDPATFNSDDWVRCRLLTAGRILDIGGVA